MSDLEKNNRPTPPDAEFLIRAEGLRFTYENSTGEDGDAVSTPVLRGIDLTVRRGEYVAILGHNGSGKSTLAKLLNLILEPTEGNLWVEGYDLTDPDLSDEDVLHLRQKVGMVFQNPDNQLVATVVEDDVAFGPENLGVPSAEIRARVDRALAAVGMSDYAHREPSRLSGGQKQRVAIAGILAMEPECMIFDESTAMLDPIGRREVLDAIRMLNREKGITVLTITHYMDEAARADRVIVLDDGVVRMDGTPAEVFDRPDELRAMGLDVPQCTRLIQALRREGYEMRGDVSSLTSCRDMILRAAGIGGGKNA